jgi:hypothetical protein
MSQLGDSGFDADSLLADKVSVEIPTHIREATKSSSE